MKTFFNPIFRETRKLSGMKGREKEEKLMIPHLVETTKKLLLLLFSPLVNCYATKKQLFFCESYATGLKGAEERKSEKGGKKQTF